MLSIIHVGICGMVYGKKQTYAEQTIIATTIE